MRTVDYSDVLRGSAALAGLQPGDLSSTEFALMRTAHDRRLQVAWECHRWPEICEYERRSFRAPWSATTAYVATNEVLDIPTMTYLQALQPSTNQPPTTNGQVNMAYWAPSLMQYQADDYVAGSSYAIGAQVRNPADNQFYQLFVGNIGVAGAGYGGANGTYVFQSIPGAVKPSYTQGTFTLVWVSDALAGAGAWAIIDLATETALYASASNVASPDLATDWYSTDDTFAPNPVNNPVPAFTLAAFVADGPTTPTEWGVLTPFNRYVGYTQAWETDAIGEFLGAWDYDPRMTTKTAPLPYVLSADGAQFTTLRHVPAYVWLLLRLRRPTLEGAAYDPTALYLPGYQVYYVNIGGSTAPDGSPTIPGVGNFYTCAVEAGANVNPENSPNAWTLVALPYTFRQYLIQGGYADWLASDGQTDKAGAMEQIAEQMLEAEADKLQRQQQQVNRLTWKG